MEPVEIREAGLLLRPWRADDAEDVYRACQDPVIQRWTGVPSPYLMEHATGYVGPRSAAAWRDGTAAIFGVFDEADGRMLGSCGLVSIDRILNSAEVGYWTAPWERGRGVAVRAVRGLSRWAFADLGLARLVWQAEIGNHASRLVALRAGFRIEGQLRLAAPRPDGSPDAWIGSLLPGEVPDPDTPADQRPGEATTGRPAQAAGLLTRRAAVFGRPQPVLRAAVADGEIHLRPPSTADHDAIVETARDPAVVRWTTVPDPYQPGDAEYFVGVHAAGRWARGDGAVFTIVAADRFAGVIELRISPTDPAVADVGCMMSPAARGRGYAPAALRALARWAFDELAVVRLEWHAEVGNEASMRVARKAGLTEEGVARAWLLSRHGRRDAWTAALVAGDRTEPLEEVAHDR